MLRYLSVLSLLIASVVAVAQQNYTTNFKLTENPISESGKWANGHKVGLDWTDIRTVAGTAYGTQDGSGRKDDSVAILKGKWSPDQTAQATLRLTNRVAIQDVKLFLRSSLAAHKFTGYEVKFSAGEKNYAQIIRRNGNPQDTTTLASADNLALADGDKLSATTSGNSISVSVNGQQVLQASDSTFSNGSPGVGFFVADGGTTDNVGLSAFTVNSTVTPKLTQAATTTTGGGTYTTNFPLTENPISEGGKWINGLTTGLQWQNVRTTTGFAFGTESGSVNFDDSTAVLTGSWGPDQTAQATVKIVQADSGGFEEVEIRLRTTITANSITGYEINCSVIAGNPYIQIVRWNGPFGNWTELDGRGGVGCQNGDVLKATISGSTITAYKNGVAQFSVTDSTFTSGAPGIGFYLSGGSSALDAHFGFSSFTATDGTTSSAPNPPTGLTATPH